MNKQQRQPQSDFLKGPRIEVEEAEARTRARMKERQRQEFGKSFEIRLGQSRRLLRLEPEETPNRFAVYSADPAELTGSSHIGTIAVISENKFKFKGQGVLTEEELQSLAAQIARHLQFKKL